MSRKPVIITCEVCGKTKPTRKRNNRPVVKYCSPVCVGIGVKASRPVEIRFWEKVTKTDSCWIWNVHDNGGYGTIGDGEKTKLAHRLSYEIHLGPIPAGLVIDHICRIRSCVNPAHLRLVTIGENSTENSVSPSALNKLKTHCKHGHKFDEKNTKVNISPNGSRHRACRKCSVRSSVKLKQIKRGTYRKRKDPR